MGSWESFWLLAVSGLGRPLASCLLGRLLLFCSFALLLCLEIIWRRLGSWGHLGPSGSHLSWAVLKLLGPCRRRRTPSSRISGGIYSLWLQLAGAGRSESSIECTPPGEGKWVGATVSHAEYPQGVAGIPLRSPGGGGASKFEQSVVAHSVRGSRFGHRDHMKSKATVLVLAAWGLRVAELKS